MPIKWPGPKISSIFPKLGKHFVWKARPHFYAPALHMAWNPQSAGFV